MTPERFLALLDSCGADLRRWPEVERDPARALLEGGPAGLLAAHSEAARLDRELDAHRVAAPDAATIDRIAAAAMSSAPLRPGHSPDRRARPWWRGGPFWPRAGWALTGLAGAFAGALVVSAALGDGYPAPAVDWQKRGTAFTDRAADWSEE